MFNAFDSKHYMQRLLASICGSDYIQSHFFLKSRIQCFISSLTQPSTGIVSFVHLATFSVTFPCFPHITKDLTMQPTQTGGHLILPDIDRSLLLVPRLLC